MITYFLLSGAEYNEDRKDGIKEASAQFRMSSRFEGKC